MIVQDARRALTPDFYDYPWLPPKRATISGRFVDFVWPDGVTLQAFDLWLRENCVGTGVDIATREGLVDPAELDLETRCRSVMIESDGTVRLRFDPDGSEGVYHPGWLRHVADGSHRATSFLPDRIRWTPSELVEPPSHDGPAALADDVAFGAWLNDLVAYGLARLRGLPDDPDIALVVASKIGAVRDTNFGPIWDVKADIELAGRADTNSTANTNLRLGPHSDLPTRETPPGFQFLHCYVNDAAGGHSTMADGEALVAAIRTEHPDHYESLTKLRWTFFNRGPGLDHRWSGPIIDGGHDGVPLTLRAFYPVRAFPDMAPADMPRAYAAMQCFSTLAASARFQIAYPLERGDLVGFDNRRILHGRDRFETGGMRHLRGMYIDHDDVLSATRVANRRAAGAASASSNLEPTTTKEAGDD